MSWLASRDGGAQRAGIKAVLPENGVVADLTATSWRSCWAPRASPRPASR
jgi:hypothetical protein